MSNNNEKKSSRKFWIVGSILLILLVIAVMVVINRRNFRKNQQESQQKQVSSAVSDRTFKVQRDDLPIGLIQGGTVNASKKHKLSLRANFGTKLLWIIEENSWVKAGDVLIKFETDDLKKRIEDYEIDLDNLTKELAIAIEEEKILGFIFEAFDEPWKGEAVDSCERNWGLFDEERKPKAVLKKQE